MYECLFRPTEGSREVNLASGVRQELIRVTREHERSFPSSLTN